MFPEWVNVAEGLPDELKLSKFVSQSGDWLRKIHEFIPIGQTGFLYRVEVKECG